MRTDRRRVFVVAVMLILIAGTYLIFWNRIKVISAIKGTPNALLVVSQHYVVAATNWGGGKLRVYDIANLNSPRRVFEKAVTYSPDSPARSAAVTDLAATTDRIYAVASSGYEPKDTWSLVVFDATDPSYPKPVGAWSRPGSAIRGMTERSGTVYLATDDTAGRGAVRAIDVHRPDRPVEISSVMLPLTQQDILVDDDTLWVGQAGNPSRLASLNIVDPTRPSPLGSTPIPSACNDAETGVQIYNHQVYLVTGDGVCVFDVSRPSTPSLIHQVSRSNWARIGGVLVTDNRLFLSDAFGVETFNGLHIYSLDSRYGPQQLFSTSAIYAVPLAMYQSHLITSGYWTKGHADQELIIAEAP